MSADSALIAEMQQRLESVAAAKEANAVRHVCDVSATCVLDT